MSERLGLLVRSSTRTGLRRKLLRYAVGSVVATVCSECVFLLVYGGFGAAPAAASVLGWLAGAIPNYWLNRTWTWSRRGRPSLRRELVPYVCIVVVTLVIAAVSTTCVDHLLDDERVTGSLRVALVGGTFLAVYGAVFVVRFFLLDTLFGRDQSRADANRWKEAR